MTLKTLMSSMALCVLLASPAWADTLPADLLLQQDFFSDQTTIADVQAELDKGARLDVHDQVGENPLYRAVWGDTPIDVLEFMIDKGAPLQPPAGKRGEIAMLGIIARGDLGLIQYAVAHGGDLQAMDDIGEGGLHSLCYAKHFDPAVLKLLLAAGGEGNDPLHQNSYGETIAMNVVWSEADNAIELLDAYIALGADPSGVRSEGWDAFMGGIAYSDNFDLIERYYAVSEDPRARDNEGLDALLMAAGGGIDQKKFDWLIAKGFDPNARSNKGENAIILAGASGEADSLKIWLDHGQDVNSRDNDGKTPLLNALSDHEWVVPAVVTTLIDSGADAKLANNKGVTPLMELLLVQLEEPSEEDAAAFPALLPLLLDKGADWKAVDAAGDTTLVYALKGHQPLPVIEQILAAGVDVNAVDTNGSTALMEAVLSSRDPAIVETLIKAGADVTVKDAFEDDLVAMAGDNDALKDNPVIALLK